jgi:hypothetical protein
VVLEGFDDFVFLAVHDGSFKRLRLPKDGLLDAESGRGVTLINAISTD